MITLTWDTVPWIAFPLIPNETIATMTEPTFLGGYVDLMVTAVDVAPAVPPAQSSFAFGIRPLPQRTLEAAQATVGGAAPIPLPFSDAEASWPYVRYGYVSTAGIDTAARTSGSHDDLSLVRMHDLIRSKRKLSEDDALVGIVELLGVAALPPTGNVCFAVHSRLLLKQ